MRQSVTMTFVFCVLLNHIALAQNTQLILATDSSQKTRVGVLISETPTEVVLRDIKDGTEVRAPKVTLKKYEKGVSEETAIRAAGLPAMVAWNVAQNAGRDNPVGKVVNVAQNVIYITLGSDKAVAVGRKLNVHRKKNEILDPDTKKVIAVERPKIGIIEITEVNKEFSKAKLVSNSEIDVQVGDEVESDREKFQVAVLPFRNESGQLLNVAVGLAEEMTTQMVRQDVSVLERSALDKLVDELVLQNSVLFEPANIQKLGQLAGASAIVTGKIVVTGKVGTAYARLIDVRTGKILYAASAPISVANAVAVNTPTTSSRRTPTPSKSSTSKSVEELRDEAIAAEAIGKQFMRDKNFSKEQIEYVVKYVNQGPRSVNGAMDNLLEYGEIQAWLTAANSYMAKREATGKTPQSSNLRDAAIAAGAVAKKFMEEKGFSDDEIEYVSKYVNRGPSSVDGSKARLLEHGLIQAWIRAEREYVRKRNTADRK